MENSLLFDRAKVANDWHARGFSCGLWIDHAGREWSNHPRQTDELFMMMSGELELEVAGKIVQPEIGEEIRIPAGMPHTIRNIGGKTARWLYGQRQEMTPSQPTAQPVRERSFHPEIKRKRRPEKKVSPLEVSNNSQTSHNS